MCRPGPAHPAPFIGYLDEGGYARYDEQTVARLQALSEIIGERHAGRAAVNRPAAHHLPRAAGGLSVLPGLGPVTIQPFLR